MDERTVWILEALDRTARGTRSAQQNFTQTGRVAAQAGDRARTALDRTIQSLNRLAGHRGFDQAGQNAAQAGRQFDAMRGRVEAVQERLANVARVGAPAVGTAFSALGGVARGVLGGILGVMGTLARSVLSLASQIAGVLVNAFTGAIAAASRFGAIAGGALTAAGGFFGKMGLDANRFKESQLAALTAMTRSRSEAEKLFAFYSRLADQTPFDDQEIASAGKALEAFGLNSRRYLPLAADTAAAMKTDLEQVARVLATMKMGSFDMAQAATVGISREGLTPFGARFKSSGEPENPQQLLPAATAFLQSRFGGTATRSQGYDAQASTAESNIRRIAQRSTEGLFGSITRSLASVNEQLTRILDGAGGQRLISALAVPFDLIGRALERATAQLPAFVGWLSGILTRENVVGMISNVAGWMHALTDRVKDFLGAVTGGNSFSSIWEAFGEAGKKAIDLVLRGWSALTRGVFFLVDNREQLANLWKDFGAQALAAFDMIVGGIRFVGEALIWLKTFGLSDLFKPIADLYGWATGRTNDRPQQPAGPNRAWRGQLMPDPTSGAPGLNIPGPIGPGEFLGKGFEAFRQPGAPVQYDGWAGAFQQKGAETRKEIGRFFGEAVKGFPENAKNFAEGFWNAVQSGWASGGIDSLEQAAKRHAQAYNAALGRFLGPAAAGTPGGWDGKSAPRQMLAMKNFGGTTAPSVSIARSMATAIPGLTSGMLRGMEQAAAMRAAVVPHTFTGAENMTGAARAEFMANGGKFRDVRGEQEAWAAKSMAARAATEAHYGVASPEYFQGLGAGAAVGGGSTVNFTFAPVIATPARGWTRDPKVLEELHRELDRWWRGVSDEADAGG